MGETSRSITGKKQKAAAADSLYRLSRATASGEAEGERSGGEKHDTTLA